jgi:hypothetical protein
MGPRLTNAGELNNAILTDIIEKCPQLRENLSTILIKPVEQSQGSYRFVFTLRR